MQVAHKVDDTRTPVRSLAYVTPYSLALCSPVLMDKKNIIQQNPRDAHFVADPYSLYARFHSLGTPIFWQDYGIWCLSSFRAVNSVLRDRRFARLPPGAENRSTPPSHMQNFAIAEKYSLLALEPPEHTRLRKAVNRAFVSRQVNKLRGVITNLAHEYVDIFENRGSVELLAEYATPLAVRVITQLLGVPAADGPKLVNWSHKMVRIYTRTQTREDEIEANHAAGQFIHYLKNHLAQKCRQPDDDLISYLMSTAFDGHRLDDDEIVSVTILLLNAGHEATVHQLGNAVYTLLTVYPVERREELFALLNNDASADAVVAECLRFDAPLHMFTRFAQEEVELDAGVVLDKGDEVGLLLAAANRCPHQFTNAGKFDPLRKDAMHLSLGAGVHFCVGAQLAKLELRIALQVLFKRLPTLRLTTVPTYQNTYHFHGLSELQLIW